MAYDLASMQFVLSSTNYPLLNTVYFRAVSSAPNYAASLSNVVGPFNLASNLTPAGQTVIQLVRNSVHADLDFRATETSAPSGVSLHVQSSTNPSDAASWANLQDASSGQMVQSGSNSSKYVLLLNNYPPATGIFFRVRASAPGSLDGLSNIIGPYKLVADTPPVVTISSPVASSANDPQHPVIINGGQLTITADAMPGTNRSITSLSIVVDGSVVGTAKAGTTHASVNYSVVIGAHLVEAVAIDDLGAIGRAGTSPVYIQVNPGGSAAVKAELVSGVEQKVAQSAGGNVFTFVKGQGLWTDPTSWADGQGNAGVPGANDLAIINSGIAALPSGPNDDGVGYAFIDIGAVSLTGGTIEGNSRAILTIKKMLTVSGGSAPNLNLSISQAATCELLNDVDFSIAGGSISNEGTLKIHGRGGIVGLSEYDNHGVSDFQMPLILQATLASSLPPDDRVIATVAFKNAGSVLSGGVPGLISQDGGGVISNDGGTLVSQGGGNVVSHDGGTLIGEGGNGVVSHDGGTIVSHNGGNVVSNDGGTLVSQGGGNITVGVGASIFSARPSSSNLRAATAVSGYTQTSGETDMNRIQITGPVAINGGVLSGSGVIAGDLTLNGGYISPGHSAGLLAVTGNYTQAAPGVLILENGGSDPLQYDQLQVGGTATLDGLLDIRTINGYQPATQDTFNPIGYGAVSGTFSTVSSNAQVSLNSTGLVGSIDLAKPQPSTGQPLNIATRLQIQSGDNVLIGGFIITGPVGSTKKVLIRGLGPSLANFGVSGTIPDPLLELHKDDGSTITNDNWKQAPNAADIPPRICSKQ